jgi:hypothetical protein
MLTNSSRNCQISAHYKNSIEHQPLINHILYQIRHYNYGKEKVVIQNKFTITFFKSNIADKHIKSI